ncbi:CLUMA_CG015784, isoform A [Clunio marinus]|uniref:Peroxisomal membrane protein PEX14 n=1 Tax=Clunio marinus TaxID=568069 RepID=A0A1J1ITX0_9DIPT|nr:CLUMA_CG015784, isoform A [Clunio marinus]
MEDPRETAIVTAVNFLKNPKVTNSTLIQKRNFLASKGLTEAEIQKAFEKVGIFIKMSDIDNNENNTSDSRIYIGDGSNYNKHQLTTFEKIKDIISSAALISGIAYAIYMFYKKFIEPILFGRKKKGDQIDELTRTTKAINGELIRVRDEINKQKQTQESNQKLLQNTMQSFKQEIETIKGILLNRKQFATPTQSVGIPSWQLNKKKSQDKNDDAGSAHSANSSENDTELIHEEESQKRSPANSDSSLEIM